MYSSLQEHDHSSDSGASSGDDDEDEEAKAARQGKRSKAAKSSAETDAIREASRQVRAQSKKKSKKRPRDADVAEDDSSFDPEAVAGGKVFVSDGPLAVANCDNESTLVGNQAQPRELFLLSASQHNMVCQLLLHSACGLHCGKQGLFEA